MDPVVVPVDVELLTPEGVAVTLGSQLVAPVTIVQLVRYYGCLPCQQWAVDISGLRDQLAADGIGVIAVGGENAEDAAYLRDDRGVTFPLLLDPEQRVRDAVGAMKPIRRAFVDPRSGVAYLRALGEGYRPRDLPPRDTLRSPGVILVDRSGRVLWQQRGTFIGDYPPFAELIDRAREAV